MKSKIMQLGEAITLMLWGMWVGTTLFDAFSAAKVFHLMNDIASEEIWGMSIFLVGALQLALLYTEHTTISSVLSLLGMFAFIIITVFFALSNWASTATPMYFAFSIYSGLAFAEALDIVKLGIRET